MTTPIDPGRLLLALAALTLADWLWWLVAH